MMHFERKSYGRIFVQKEEDIEKVKSVIKEMDEFEYDYLPDDFIAVFSKDNMEAKYTHKFYELDTQELTRLCWERGIYMFCWYGPVNEYAGIAFEFEY